MEKICKFFENLDEFVYVADIDTYEIVYMNRKTLDTAHWMKLKGKNVMKCCKKAQRHAQYAIMPCLKKADSRNGDILIRC